MKTPTDLNNLSVVLLKPAHVSKTLGLFLIVVLILRACVSATEAVLGGIRAGKQSIWRPGDRDWRISLPLPDRAVAAGHGRRCRHRHRCVALPISQALTAQPQHGTLTPWPCPICGVYGPLGEGLPPWWPIRTQRSQQPSLSWLRGHIRARKCRRPAADLWGGRGPCRRSDRDWATTAVWGYS